ncbi:hypothetical protein HYV49_04000 [Candidatus Pacearchaeota archaeon]|nr:hypothetical protein [Candidatus Pacearchaeota archaeon]
MVKQDLNTLKEPERSKFKGIIFHRTDSASLNNVWSNPRVIYHDTGAFKGLPAIVPLGQEWGTKRGWYVATKNFDIGRANEPTAFTEAAIPQNYYICNVGGNGIQEFETGIGDDVCQFINKNAVIPNRILGLSEIESRRLISLADQHLYDAAVKYKTAVQSRAITLEGASFPVDVSSIAQGPRCQDFMSASDCNILFNACDPVLCPSSRCDLGGAYPVSNVIQTGIVGGAVLCLPNFREGIVAPVCLTGIHAGLDAYNQIQRAAQQCLQESLSTGRSIGICDEIKSVYTCEFFWRQIAPFTKLALPKLVELAAGKGYRGGQEYATFLDSWKQADNTIGYIRDEYAVDAYRAFLLRSTEEVGTEVCKAFISTRYPVDKRSFENFIEPDSPVQFHAKFDEISFTEATTPPTSQYKVYYFIYAGRDEGAYYSVYLKSPPQTGFFAESQIQPVATGFVPKGKFVDEARDFTAPAGYKELCVRINGKDECGFKSVSTSFAVNYIKDKVAQELAEQEVRTEEECVSGAPSIGALINPNIQEGVQEAINPEIYKRGVIRICASRNPGDSVDPRVGTEAARWKQVGFCGNENIKCWLDTESVKDAVRNKNIEKEAIGDIQDLQSRIIGDKIEEKEAIDSISELRTKWKGDGKSISGIKDIYESDPSKVLALDSKDFKESEVGKLLARATDIENRAPLDKYQAQAVFLRFTIYRDIAQILFDNYKNANPTAQDKKNVNSDNVKELKTEQKTGSTSAGTSVIKYSKEILITLDYDFPAGFDDLLYVRWNFEKGKPEVSVVVNKNVKKSAGWVDDPQKLFLDADAAGSVHSQDIFYINNILASKTPDELSFNVLQGLKTRLTWVPSFTSKRIGLTIQDVNQALYEAQTPTGTETATGAGTTPTGTVELTKEEKCSLNDATINEIFSLTSAPESGPFISNPRVLKLNASSDCEGIEVDIKVYDEGGNIVDSNIKSFEKQDTGASLSSAFSVQLNTGNYFIRVYCPADQSREKCVGTENGYWLRYFEVR